MHIDLSIIIPAFNASLFIEKCLASIINDYSNDNIEIIVVNDCSTDKTLDVVENFSLKDSRIKIISNEINKKLSVTRQVGINASVGDYIMHIDADDWIVEGSIASILDYIKKFKSDVLVYNYYQEQPNGKRFYPKNKISKLEEFEDKFEAIKFFYGATVTKVVKRDLVLDLEVGNYQITNSEDFVYSIEVLLKAKKILLIPDYYYVYFQNVHSVTKNIDFNSFLSNQTYVVMALNNLFYNYDFSKKFENNIKRYFINYIIVVALGQKNKLKKDWVSIFKNYNKYGLFSDYDLSLLGLGIKYKYFAFFLVLKKYGFKKAIYQTFRN